MNKKRVGYDIIGDVHGYASNLIRLLEKLGYREIEGVYQHPTRKVIFVGDFIDRGLEEEKVLNIAKKMIENDKAKAVMGNHEFNAICYATKNEMKQYIRPHNEKNYLQHKEFLNEYPFGSKKHKEMIEWFKTLPIFLEIEGFRVIHAAWVNEVVEYVKPMLNENNTLNDKVLMEFSKIGGEVFKALETLMKGVELNLPEGYSIADKFGQVRTTMRYNWYTKKERITYKECGLSIPEGAIVPNIEIKNPPSLYKDQIPVFFGHYWMSGKPKIQSPYVACVDYSVAKEGYLVAYRYDGETKLSNDKFVFIK